MTLKQLALAGGNQGKDPYFNNVSLLLHGDGNNGGQNNTFLDSSSNNLTITRNGNVTQGTFSPFSAEPGKWSNYFDGNGDYLSISSNAAFNLGTGDFTIECWVYNNSVSTWESWISTGTNADGTGNGYKLGRAGSSNQLTFGIRNGIDYTNYNSTTTGTWNLNTWNHAAVVRQGTSITLYWNGINAGTFTNISTTCNGGSGVTLGCRYGIDANTTMEFVNGNTSNLRVIKGVAVYTGNFTPPSKAPLATSGAGSIAAYPSTTNVNTTFASTSCSLLTCQDNRFKDNSLNNFTLTPYGDVKVTPTSPFAPSLAYNPSVHGGSGYFDGSGDYLSINNNPVYSGDFTIHGWFYCKSYRTTQNAYYNHIFCQGNSLNTAFINAAIVYNGTLSLGVKNDALVSVGASGTPRLFEWNHFAICRSGTTVKFFLNGIMLSSSSLSGMITIPGGTYIGTSGWYPNNEMWDGYISGIQTINGTALYTSNFTPPTAPLTAITNTSLLCNFTNANIIDSSRKNDLETIGNAQVSTTTKKFGTGAMYFDGNGDNLYIPFNPNLNFGSSDFTVECWIYRTAITDATYGDVIIYNFYTNPWSWGLCVNPDNKLGVVLSSTGTTWDMRLGSDPGYPRGSVNIALNTWHHIVFVRKGSVFSTYVNGILDQQFSSSATISNSSTSTTIGRCHDGWTRYWNGYIDDLRVTKGICRYDYPGTTLGVQTFTPPTRSLPNQ